MTLSAPSSPWTLGTLRDDILDRLGDTAAVTPEASRVWTEAEIENYIRDGVNDFCMTTKLLWDMRHVDDLPFSSNYDAAWEKPYFIVGDVIHEPNSFDAPGDKDFQTSSISPSNHDYTDERDYHLTEDLISAVERLPDALYQIDRVTWDGFKAIPLQSRRMARLDNYFEVIRGRVFGYLQDRDGLRTIRKWKVPAARALYYIAIGKFGILSGSSTSSVAKVTSVRMHIDQFGVVVAGVTDIAPTVFGMLTGFAPPAGSATFSAVVDALTAIAEFASDLIRWRFGFLRRLPGYFPANGPHGLVKRISQDGTNTRVEFFRRHHPLNTIDAAFELPDYMIMHIRCYALWKAYSRQGIGQDLKFAEHYRARYAAGIARTVARIQAIYKSKVYRMGGPQGEPIYKSKPYARLPRNI